MLRTETPEQAPETPLLGRPERPLDDRRQRVVAGAPRAPVRELRRQPLEHGERLRTVEDVGRERRLKRSRAVDERERGDDQRKQDGGESSPVQPRVEHLAPHY
jgi:hypothetical protein